MAFRMHQSSETALGSTLSFSATVAAALRCSKPESPEPPEPPAPRAAPPAPPAAPPALPADDEAYF